MQLNLFLILAFASPAMSATLQWYQGANCDSPESIVATSNSASSGECISVTNGGSVRSIGYSGVLNTISFYVSGGGHDVCTNGARLTKSDSSGCETAPDGFNWESVSLD